MIKKNPNERFLCPVCGCEEYNIVKNRTRTYDDETNELIGECPSYMAECKKCRQPVFMKYIDKENRKILSKFDREHFNLLPLEKIKMLPRRYNVSREDFLTIMGFGKTHDIDGNNSWEYFDIWDGDTPIDAEEKKLKKVLEDPRYYAILVEDAQGRIPKEVYDRTLKRAKQLAKKYNEDYRE